MLVRTSHFVTPHSSGKVFVADTVEWSIAFRMLWERVLNAHPLFPLAVLGLCLLYIWALATEARS